MGPMAIRASVCTRTSSIAIVSIVTLAAAAHAQVATNGDTAGGSLNNATSAPTVRAPLLTYGVDAGIGESDNVTLVSTNKVSQTIATADVDFAVKEQTRLLDVNAKGDFSYFDYLQNAYSNQLLGRFDGAANVAIVPERLMWTVQDSFGQAALDPYTPQIPTNIEDINYFTTGPDLSMRFDSVNFMNVSARYARTQYQTSPYNSNRALGSIGIGRDVSAGATISLNATAERAMFEDTVLNTDFDRTSAFGRYELHGARTDFSTDLGASKVSQGGTSTNGSLAKISLSRQISPSAKLIFAAGRELTDGSTSFNAQSAGAIGGGITGTTPPIGGGISGTAPASQTSNNYTSNHASIAWQYLRNRTTVGVTARWEKDTYEGQPTLDLTHPWADFNIGRQLTSSLRADLLGRWSKMDYPNAVVSSQAGSSNYDDWLVGGSLTWRHGRGLEIRLRYDHASHVVSEGSSGYGENRVFLTVGYRPNPTPGLAEPQ
jgi:hypothetical protein